jgi:hypothetical protein
MPGLPKAPSTLRRRLIWEVMIIGGVERLTDSLRRGDEFSDADLRDMQALDMRLSAFSAALAQRVEQARAQGELIED